MTATVNGANWEAEIPAAAYTQGRMGITDTSSDDMTIVISLDYPTLEATSFELDQSSLSAIAYTESTGANAHTSNGSALADGATSGTLTINAHDLASKTISGTFNFEAAYDGGTGTNTVSLTNGQFSMTY